MTKENATPGPWSYDSTWSLILGPNEEEVAAVHAAHAPGEAKRFNPATAAANARLIAAAPEMAEALAEILSGQLSGNVDPDAERFQKARAILAKAGL